MSMVIDTPPPLPREAEVPPGLKWRIKNSIAVYRKGIELSRFQKVFLKNYGHELCYSNFGFESLKALILSISEINFNHEKDILTWTNI